MANKQNFVISVIGILFSFIFPPYNFILLGMLLSIILLIIEKTENLKLATKRAFIFGYFYNLSNFYWVINSLLIEPKTHGILIPFALVLLPMYMTIYIAVPLIIFYKLRDKRFAIYVVASSWLICEYIKSFMLSGFPWADLNLALSSFDLLIQLAPISLSFVSAVALLIFSLPYLFYKKDYLNASIFSLLIITSVLYGHYRLRNAETLTLPYKLAIIQPNIAQSIKWDPKLSQDHLKKLINMTLSAELAEDNMLYIWPESALPYSLNKTENQIYLLQDLLRSGDMLITGVDRFELENTKVSKIYNSLIAINNTGIIANYDKIKLLPFGEYVPFIENLSWIVPNITGGTMNFTVGDSKKFVNNLHPTICSEIIFKQKPENASAILNISNSAWFGNSKGPIQMFYIAKMRAAEAELPLIMVSNSGPSGIIDKYGRIVNSSMLGEEKIISNS